MTKYTQLDEIITVVSSEYGIPADVILSPQMRTPPVVHARHVAMYLACKLTYMSKDAIAGGFNQRDHSSIFYGLNRISKRMVDSAEVKERVEALTKRLQP